MIHHPEKSVILKEDIPDDCVVHAPVWIGKHVRIGHRCKIQAFAFIPDGVVIGSDVFIGPHVCFTNDKKPQVSKEREKGEWMPERTIVERNVSIGAGAVIVSGVTIGRGATIGAGAVVTKNVFPGETWVGNPARPLVGG